MNIIFEKIVEEIVTSKKILSTFNVNVCSVCFELILYTRLACIFLYFP